MEELMKKDNIFELSKYEKTDMEDFSYKKFIDLDFLTNDTVVSFFRSDFRGSTFENIKFFKNIFDRADFLTSNFSNSYFSDVNFGASQFKTCYFSQVHFNGNKYKFTSILDCVFENCTFENENIMVNMLNTTFNNCKFTNVTFERSTTEKCIFNNCEFNTVDFATMHAECHTLSSCNFTDLSMDFTYILGYRLFDISVENIKLLYHGKPISHTKLSEHSNSLLRKNRYYEFINTCIITKRYEILEQALNSILNDFTNMSELERRYQLNEMFDIFAFYTSKCVLPYSTIKQTIAILLSFDWSIYGLSEKLTYGSKLTLLKNIFEEADATESYIESAKSSYTVITLKYDIDDFDIAMKEAEKVLDMLYQKLQMEPNYELIKSEKGSWILTFCAITASVLLLQKLVINQIEIFEKYDKWQFKRSAFEKIIKEGTLLSGPERSLIMEHAITPANKLTYDTIDEFFINFSSKK